MKAFLYDMQNGANEKLLISLENGIPYTLPSNLNYYGNSHPELYLEMLEKFLLYFYEEANLVDDVDLGQWRKGLEVMIQKAKGNNSME
jgi:hypothetical protein